MSTLGLGVLLPFGSSQIHEAESGFRLPKLLNDLPPVRERLSGFEITECVSVLLNLLHILFKTYFIYP